MAKLDSAMSLTNLPEFDVLFLNFVCVRTFFHADFAKTGIVLRKISRTVLS